MQTASKEFILPDNNSRSGDQPMSKATTSQVSSRPKTATDK